MATVAENTGDGGEIRQPGGGVVLFLLPGYGWHRDTSYIPATFSPGSSHEPGLKVL
jgi:hypothetical protein